MKKIKRPKMKLSEKLVNTTVKYFAGILLVTVAIYGLKGSLPPIRYYIMFVVMGFIAIILLILLVELILWAIKANKNERLKMKNSKAIKSDEIDEE